jgi:RND family efflux transporter MFP subunit
MLSALTAIGLLGGGVVLWLLKGHAVQVAWADEPPDTEAPTAGIRVEVIKPKKGGLDRVTVQPGTVQSYESVQLFAEVSGYLKKQAVDIGDRVKKDQVLVELDVPELDKQVEKWEASLNHAKAHVRLTRARVTAAQAEWEAAKAMIPQAQATLDSAVAMRKFRQKQLLRMEQLFRQQAVDERLVDEKEDQQDAALATERAGTASVVSARSQEAAAAAKVEQARADVADAEAQVLVAQAELDRARVMVRFAAIHSPFDGVITKRALFPGDFVRSAKEGGQVPLLSVDRTDKVRVVVQVPDRDVPYTDPGDPATVEIDALPGQEFHGVVSRTASSEDPQTRLMRVEIDLPNPDGKLRQGMYGRVSITLDQAPRDAVTVPSSCLVGKADKGEGAVYVVREGKAYLTPVRVGMDNGIQAEVLKGLAPDEEVVNNPPGGVGDGVEVDKSSAAGRRP